MIQAAAFDDTDPPDWEALQALAAEAQQLVDDDEWNRDEFERLWKAGKKAVNGHDEFLECLALHADPDWL